jgi:hypothetical protein
MLIGGANTVALYVLSAAVGSIVGFVGHNLIRKTMNVLDDRILEVVPANVRPLMIAIGLQIAAREVRRGVTDSALQFTRTARCSSFPDLFSVETMLRELAYRAFRERQVPMPLLQWCVYVKSEM